MPIFEYACQTCGNHFEALVSRDRQAACPQCSSVNLEKQLSVFAVSTSSGRPAAQPIGSCGTCGDPRGPGACSLN